MKKSVWLVLCAVLAALCSGCVNVDYVGQKFEPLEEFASVRIFKADTDYPADEYKVIGRATFTAPDDYSSVDMWEKVTETAREYGADAVKVVASGKVLVNSIYRQPEQDRRSRSAANGISDAYIDSFGNQVSGGKYGKVDEFRLEMKALMLVNTQKYDSVMAKRAKTDK